MKQPLLYTSREPIINRRGFARPAPSRAYRLRHVIVTITKWFPKYGKLSETSSLCPFGNVLRVLLAQIVLGSDYAQKGLERERSRVKKAFLCTRTMGVSAPSLHRESTDSLIHTCVAVPSYRMFTILIATQSMP